MNKYKLNDISRLFLKLTHLCLINVNTPEYRQKVNFGHRMGKYSAQLNETDQKSVLARCPAQQQWL